MKRFFTALTAIFLFTGLSAQNVPVVPLPAHVQMNKGSFKVPEQISIVYHDAALEELRALMIEFYKHSGVEAIAKIQNPDVLPAQGAVLVQLEKPFVKELGTEGYHLEVSEKNIFISANTQAGLLYGMQTLLQILTSDLAKEIPCMQITDYPRFSYRGLHLDVSRHFMPIEFIFKLMDYMAMHKLNVFHWHLVDDQGWRLEIKKYPRLTEVGAWREDRYHQHWNSRGEADLSKPQTYGGFYTQQQVKELVAYAAKRNITVIPEIEMPAHVMSALAAYPEFSCTSQNLGVPPGGVWPITHIYCAGKDATFEFLQDILLETMSLFPSTYIHVGGDEADKTEWKKCPLCQKRIKDEGLEDEHALQSYFIQRIERFLNAHGRKLMGWDEILEGGLPPRATVMSWRGEEGGIEAAKAGNTVVMTPGSHCYFDHYQGEPGSEPLAIGSYTTLAKVYDYEPIPAELTAEQAKLVLGAQANVWTEYMPVPSHVEYMVFPRLSAMSEVLWSKKESRSWESFSRRMEPQYKRYDKLGINYALSSWQVKMNSEINPENNSLKVHLTSDVFNPEIRYTLNGKNPDAQSTLYTGPFEIKRSARLKAVVMKDGKAVNQIMERDIKVHKAFAKEVKLQFPNRPQYDGHGKYGLVDGIRGSNHYGDGMWKGFLKDDMVAEIDLGMKSSISRIEVDALQNAGSWIFFPTNITIEVSSDGVNYRVHEQIVNKVDPMENGKLTQVFSSTRKASNVRFVRITAKNLGVCPQGHSGEGKSAWLFVSEIVIE